VAEYLTELSRHSARPVAYVDETGIDAWLHREYGWSKRGSPLIGRVRGRKHARTGIVAALMDRTILAPLQYGDTMDSVFFEKWFADRLLPALPEGSVIVMDNATFHRKGRLFPIAREAGHLLLFLPPYSPGLNPIENFWAWLKRRLAKILPSYSSLNDAICACFQVG